MSETGWSLSEAASLAVKAARGGGYDWGLAEEAGFAVEWLQARGAPGVEALAALLDTGPTPPKACPLRLGASLCDGAIVLASLERPIAQPLLLIPFVVTALPQTAHRVSVDGSVWDVAATGMVLNGPAMRDSARLTFSSLAEAPTGGCFSRVEPQAKAAMRRLSIHAHKTYAPATEASRLAGAGAGLNDND
ncbi:DUF3726 domain-containing protein [Pseudahrensia aquimaris]|uniref:DUF3726 domain-containing protein n=1 Tax=Pseudahrensia aquimaris TaxID=744461 RepID=A0ABW3FN28_9HYPH